jgi:hypothetical protein
MNEINLLSRIQRAFPSGRANGILVTLEEDEEALEETQLYINKSWTEIYPSQLWAHAEAYSFFTDSAFSYFLPSVMRGAILDLHLSHLAVDKVLARLLEATSIPIFQELTPIQVAIVEDWLQWLLDNAQRYGWSQRIKCALRALQM